MDCYQAALRVPSIIAPQIHDHVQRWHANLFKDCVISRTLVVYGDYDVAVNAVAKAFLPGEMIGAIVESGWYCRYANAIYEAGDGPTVYHDARKVF